MLAQAPSYDPLSDTSRLVRAITFGPNVSRRLGLVLGLNIMPPGRAVCTYRCAYCPLSPSVELALRPEEVGGWPRADEVAEALAKTLEGINRYFKLDAVVLIGNGEPTLHPELKSVLEAASELMGMYCPGAKLAVFTNSSLLSREGVVEALSIADYVVAKLDAVSVELWEAINRPHPAIKDLRSVISALRRLSASLSGAGSRLVVSTTLLKLADGRSNASEEHVRALARVLSDVEPHQLHLEVPLAPVSLDFEALSREELVDVALRLSEAVGQDRIYILVGTTAPIPLKLLGAQGAGRVPAFPRLSEQAELLLSEGRGARTRLRVLEALARRKMNCNQIAKAVGLSWWSAQKHLRLLLEAGLVRTLRFGRRIYYAITPSGLRALAEAKAKQGTGLELAARLI